MGMCQMWGKSGRIMGILRNFIRGLAKSFDGKDYLRDINQCNRCGKPSFTTTCLHCETKKSYRDDMERNI